MDAVCSASWASHMGNQRLEGSLYLAKLELRLEVVGSDI